MCLIAFAITLFAGTAFPVAVSSGAGISGSGISGSGVNVVGVTGNRIPGETSFARNDSDASKLTDELKPFFELLRDDSNSFALSAEVSAPIDGQDHQLFVNLQRFDESAFDLEMKHAEYWVIVRRRENITSFELPFHKVAFVGRGTVDAVDHIAPEGILQRVISDDSIVASYAPIVLEGSAASTSFFLRTALKAELDAGGKFWRVGEDISFAFIDSELPALSVEAGDVSVSLAIEPLSEAADLDWADDVVVTDIPREELERTLSRGVRRTLEVLAPGPSLKQSKEVEKEVSHGRLQYIDGQRVVTLWGSPEEIGVAHGELLPTESMHCIDSVLHAFGTVQTIINGRWFRQDLEAAYQRLAPHIPEDHKIETRALASSLGVDAELMETLNVFPELFHCSGFAVFNSATTDGKLYHGRVLDYMTTIGLQDSATTFIVDVDGKTPFANVGYASFVGSVSGMNADGISLGEMGGRGEGQWDGVPMATLMRRALEECSTLDEVIKLWETSPRTCEYYYVFADGKTNEAVGVAATPTSIEFVAPGEAHELLGAGISDAVVLSAGSRLETLRERVIDNHGSIDLEKAKWLMSRPVAMESNLHNVLFVPADGKLYVANADHDHPAAERPYVELNLRELLNSIPNQAAADSNQ